MQQSHFYHGRLFIFVFLSLFASGCVPYPEYYQYSGGYDSSEVERLHLCVKYKAEYGWSTGYSVDASIMKGSILNQKTGTFKYNLFSTYVVVFWAQGEATIIELAYYFGSLTAIPTNGKDQYGREWQVAQTDYCF